MDACTAFVHFIFLQIIALLIALIAKAYSSILPEYLPKVSLVTMSAIGYFIFIYSIYCTLAAVFAIFRVADWFDNYITKLNDSKKNNK